MNDFEDKQTYTSRYIHRHITSKPQWKRLGGTLEWLLSKETVRGNFGEQRVHEFIAAVVAMTYLEKGDSANIADDKALMIIRSLLLDFDESIIERNRHRRIPFKYFKR
jgi:hypothetical protein